MKINNLWYAKKEKMVLLSKLNHMKIDYNLSKIKQTKPNFLNKKQR